MTPDHFPQFLVMLFVVGFGIGLFSDEMQEIPLVRKLLAKLSSKIKFRNPYKILYCRFKKHHKRWYREGDTKGCEYCGWKTNRWQNPDVV